MPHVDGTIPAFGVRAIGPEPSGATPIEEDDLDGLIPEFVATRADLNQVEFENITYALPWARRRVQALGPAGIVDCGFIFALHRRMFGDVWTWAGKQRKRVTNIGVEPHLITTRSRMALDDIRFWHVEAVFGPDEVAARLHCRLAAIHPFTNGNGRCTRLMADLYLLSIGVERFTWGGADLDVDGSTRATYIAALVKAATTDDCVDLIRFARGR